jgi:hypothetical protein
MSCDRPSRYSFPRVSSALWPIVTDTLLRGTSRCNKDTQSVIVGYIVLYMSKVPSCHCMILIHSYRLEFLKPKSFAKGFTII